MPTSTRTRSGRRSRWSRVAIALALVPLGLLSVTTAVGAQEPSASTPDLGTVLEGRAPGLAAEASTVAAATTTMTVAIEITNSSNSTQQVAVPFGALFATEGQADQTVATAGPEGDPALAALAAAGETPTIDAPPGTSTHTLLVFCAEADDTYPIEPTRMRSLGIAGEPLRRVLRNIAAQQPANAVGQDAVWWVTDGATLPVPEHIEPLLAGVDVERFAADPQRVVPDTGYEPRWARDGEQDGPLYRAEQDERAAGIRDEQFDSGRSGTTSSTGSGSPVTIGLWLVAVVIGAAVLIGFAVRQASRSGTRRP